jgi:hypothetical protein
MKPKVRLSIYLPSLIAALTLPSMAPQYQNAKDLDFIVAYIRQHAAVVSTLRLIDMQNYSVHFGAQCIVQFQRGELKQGARACA